MSHILQNIFFFALRHWWILVAALVVAELLKKTEGVEEAINNFKPVSVLGGAHWADNLKHIGLFKGKGIPIGYVDGKPIHYSGQGGIITFVAARMGKGASLLMNAMLSVRCSVFCIDPKGELAAVSGNRRKAFGPVYVIDPFDIMPGAFRGLKRARYNFLDAVGSPDANEFHANCSKIAASFVHEEEGENRHFSDGGRQAASGVIAALLRHAAPEKRNLVEVARIFASLDELCTFSHNAMQSPDRFIVDKLRCFTAKDAEKSRELFDIARTVSVGLNFVQTEGVAYTISASDFSMRDLKRHARTMTVYACLPLEMDVCEKLYRVLTECFLMESLREGRTGKAKNKVLAVIDECAMLGGYMKSLENAISMGAGAAGIQLWCIFQSIVQLQSMFPKSWESFIQSCGVTTWWGCRSETDREYVSKLAGTTEVLTRSMSANVDRQTGQVMVSGGSSQHSRPLLLPHEVGEVGEVGKLKDKMIVFVSGANGPILATRKFYWKVCRGYRKNPYIKNSR